MSSYEKIQARVAADRKAAREAYDDTLKEARADIVGEILEITDRWIFKAQDYPPEDRYVHLRAIVATEVLDALVKELYDDEGDPA